LNLGQNAARFTTQGTVSLVVLVQNASERRGEITFAVRDTGQGIPPSVKSSLFSRYASVGGTGIGLHLSNELVTAFGSRLVVKSPWAASGASGTSFEFTLAYVAAKDSRASGRGADDGFGGVGAQLELSQIRPQCYTHAVSCTDPTDSTKADLEQLAAKSAGAAPSAAAATPKLPRGLSVLIADDMSVNRVVLRKVFEKKFKWSVTEAVTAEEVLNRVQTRGENYDLIVIDEHFGPRAMAGSTAVRELRNQGRDEVIIACTGNPNEAIEKLQGTTIDGVWSKPIPDWRNGDMQRELAPLLRRREATKRASSAGNVEP